MKEPQQDLETLIKALRFCWRNVQGNKEVILKSKEEKKHAYKEIVAKYSEYPINSQIERREEACLQVQ